MIILVKYFLCFAEMGLGENMNRLFVILSSFFFNSLIVASTLIPVTLEEQMRTSDALVFGQILDSSSRKTDDGIVTDYRVLVNRYIGPEKTGSLLDQHTLILTLPGGTWNGITSKTHGVPTVEKNREFAALVRKNGFSYELANLGLSLFYQSKLNSEVWESGYFAQMDGAGRLLESDMVYMAKKHLDYREQAVGNRYVKGSAQRGVDSSLSRGPASFQSSKKESRDVRQDSSGGALSFWPVLFLIILLLLSQILVRRSK